MISAPAAARFLEITVKRFLSFIGTVLKRCDLVLLFLSAAATAFRIVLISSATRSMGGRNYVFIQSFALVLGMGLYVVFSVVDLNSIAEKWKLLLVLSLLFIASLFKLGIGDETTGNKAWIHIGSLNVQPSEVLKPFFAIIVAKVMVELRRRFGLNHIVSLLLLVLLFGAFFGLIIVASSDLGSAMVYLFMFVTMLFAGGLQIYWFLLGATALALVSPMLWNQFLTQKQRNRIIAPYDPSIDPNGRTIRWQANQSVAAIASGKATGMGLYHGTRTQAGTIPKQHTDFIFSAAGEELGMLGCILVVGLLVLIIIRCIRTGMRASTRLDALVCVGIAAIMIFQTFENIGMCLGLAPVIGLTLPFFSYGGSSIITMFMCMGLVSGVRTRPKPEMFLSE